MQTSIHACNIDLDMDKDNEHTLMNTYPHRITGEEGPNSLIE